MSREKELIAFERDMKDILDQDEQVIEARTIGHYTLIMTLDSDGNVRFYRRKEDKRER